jgi:hypothetical protein
MFIIPVIARTLSINAKLFDTLGIRNLLSYYLHAVLGTTFLAQNDKFGHGVGVSVKCARSIMCAHRAATEPSIAITAIDMGNPILDIKDYIRVLNQILTTAFAKH